MGARRYSTEQIIVKLREAEIEMGRGVKVPEVCRKLGISEQTFYRWRKRSRGLPTYIRSDNGPEFTAKVVREWLGRLEVAPLFIEPGSPWENGYVESFNARLRDSANGCSQRLESGQFDDERV